MADKTDKPDSVTIILPPEPLRLTPAAAQALVRILMKAYEQQVQREAAHGGG